MRDIARFVEEEKTLLNDEMALTAERNPPTRRGGNKNGNLEAVKHGIRSKMLELQVERRNLQERKLDLESNWAKAEKIYAALQQS